jgi:uncharacterized membrane protein
MITLIGRLIDNQERAEIGAIFMGAGTIIATIFFLMYMVVPETFDVLSSTLRVATSLGLISIVIGLLICVFDVLKLGYTFFIRKPNPLLPVL